MTVSQIELRNNNIGDEGAKKLSNILKVATSLVHVDLRSNEINNAGLMHLFTSIGESKSITSFLGGNVNSMQKNWIREDGLEAIEFMVATNPLLSILDLSGIWMGDKGLEILLNGMKVHKSMVSLNISDNNISSNSMTHLADYISGSSLIELKLGGNTKIGNKGVKILSKSF